ncbi:MAG: NAD(P)-dependent oxidoreductase [Verrucomicrobiales bacterium]|nr:NAD(P)-dependent oxidoreductase [Verrucomicrobiales bacterium]
MKSVAPSDTRLGWIGTGVMGAPMAGHLLKQGWALTVSSRTRSKAEPLLAAGARWAGSPAEVAAQSDIVFSMVGFPEDVASVYFGPDGLLAQATSGSILVDLTTTRPALACEIARVALDKGIHTIDAPVSGGDVGARNATLTIMVGGDEAAVETVTPLLGILGKNIVHQGPAGAGQHAKMCNQITIAGTMIGVCESLIYGHRAGLDLETLLRAISGGAAGCWTLTNLAPRIIARNFDPGFYVEHFIKDMQIALEEAARMNLALPGLALVHQLYQAVAAQGHGRKGTHALMLALERISSTG